MPDAPAERPKVVDLMAALEASVAKAKEERGAAAAGKRSAKKAAGRTKKTA